MWLMAQEKIKKILTALDAPLIGNIVKTDQSNSWASFITTPAWMLSGKKRYFSWLPSAGIRDEKLMMSEKVGHRSFYLWGKLLLKCGQISPRFRRVVLYFYILFLIILILTVVPLSAVIKRLLKPLLKEKLARQKRYFAEPSGE